MAEVMAKTAAASVLDVVASMKVPRSLFD